MEAYEKVTSKVSNTQNSELNYHSKAKFMCVYIYIYIYIYSCNSPLRHKSHAPGSCHAEFVNPCLIQYQSTNKRLNQYEIPVF